MAEHSTELPSEIVATGYSGKKGGSGGRQVWAHITLYNSLTV